MKTFPKLVVVVSLFLSQRNNQVRGMARKSPSTNTKEAVDLHLHKSNFNQPIVAEPADDSSGCKDCKNVVCNWPNGLGYWQNPSNCSTFCQCTSNNVAVTMPCGPGTQFDVTVCGCVNTQSSTCPSCNATPQGCGSPTTTTATP